MTTTSTRISAEDLRGGLALGTQPALCNEDMTLVQQHQVDHMRRYWIDQHGVSERRFDNAVAALPGLPASIVAQLRTAFYGGQS